MKTAAQTQQLADWLAGTGIGLLELRMPDGVLRLGLDAASGRFVELTGEMHSAPAAARATAAAPSVGDFLDGHPLQATPLVRIGERVVAGQAVGLLQVGPLLLPVPAPVDGVVEAVIGPVGGTVGYGRPLVALRTG